MTPPTSSAAAQPAAPTARGADHIPTAPGGGLSLPRLYVLRFGYLVMGGGLALVKWPAFVANAGSWTLSQGVVECMLLAMSLLALLGLRYPVKMLPILLFESMWKLTWFAVVALPQLVGDGMDAATTELFAKNLWVVIILAVIPWGYVARQYLAAPGDRWRGRRPRPRIPAPDTAHRPRCVRHDWLDRRSDGGRPQALTHAQRSPSPGENVSIVSIRIRWVGAVLSRRGRLRGRGWRLGCGWPVRVW